MSKASTKENPGMTLSHTGVKVRPIAVTGRY